MNKSIIKILTSIWFLSLLISFVVYLFYYKNFQEFSVKQVKVEAKNYDDYRFFFDFNNDSIDENVDISFFETINSKGITITNNNNKIIHTGLLTPFHFPDFFVEPFCVNKTIGNVNNILYLIEMNQKIYLGTNRFDTLLEQVYLDSIFSEGEYANVPNFYDYGYIGTYDVNKDGHPELFLYIAEGYRIFPRRLYCVDYYNHKLLFKSDLFGAFPVKYQFYNINSLPYFVLGSQATSNMIDFPYMFLNDSASYFMVFDENLKFKFNPIKMGEENSRVYFFLKKIDDKPYFFVFANPYNESKNVVIKQIDIHGNFVKDMLLPSTMKAIFNGIFSVDDNIFYIDKDFNYHKFNVITEFDEKINLNFLEQPFWLKSVDLDKDGDDEYLFRDLSSNKIYITRNDFSKSAYFELPLDEIDNARFYFPKNVDHNDIIFVWTNSKYYTFEYIRVKFYLLKLFALFVFLYLISFIVVFIIQQMAKFQIKQRAKISARIKELEFQNVRNQMNPHFTLNTLNFISNSILKNERQRAYDVIVEFSNIIRSTLLDSNKILRSLDEEISFVTDYLKIQKARFGDKFNFEIINSNVDTSQVFVPPFIIQIFVENSLKHGLKDFKTGGIINISFKKEDKNFVIEIEDNGIGTKEAKSNRSENSTGKGLILTKEYIDLINSLNKEQIKLEFINKEKNQSGLIVRISVPYNLNINFIYFK